MKSSWPEHAIRQQPGNSPKRNREIANFFESQWTRDCVRPVHLRTLTSISEAAHSPFSHREADLGGGRDGLSLGEPRKA